MSLDPFQNVVQVPFDKDANVTPLGEIDGTNAQASIAAMVPGIDDLIVIAHGWNNDIEEAQTLYEGFFAAVGSAWSAAGLTNADLQRTGIVALYWPSKRFDESDLISGGAAAIGDPIDYDAAIATQIANLKDAFGQFDPAQQRLLDAALAQIPLLDSEAGQNAYVAALAGLLPQTPAEADPGLDESADLVKGRAAASGSGAALLQNISMGTGVNAAPGPAAGGAASIDDAPPASPKAGAGGAAGIDIIGGIHQAANLLLNLTTYYVMKERAGVVGASGAAPLIARALATNPHLRIHLVGHSFGGRLVTSLANSLPDGVSAATLTLLQAAYSHYGLAPAAGNRPVGAFRDVVLKKKVRDSIQITHSSHDWAVGAAYPIASFISRDSASGLPSVPGTADSLWGGMGASGAQQTPEAFDDVLLDGHAAYATPAAGMLIRNLAGDAFISAHGDVDGSQVAWAFLQGFAHARS